MFGGGLRGCEKRGVPKMTVIKYIILIIGIILRTIMYFILIIMIFSFGIMSLMNRNTLNKNQIIRFVHDNEELLNKAVAEIFELDDHITSVSHTNSRSRSFAELGFEGLYTGGRVDSRHTIAPLYNTVLYELLEDGRIRSIRIRRDSLCCGTTYQIQFAFNVRTAGYRRGGIYFSIHDVPILYSGQLWINTHEYRNGWVSYGRDFYYTERIIPHWFYYEMLLSSTRTPQW